jgi:protein-L-isoaspartate(D-aspartate) O-methyltransferase
MMIERTGDRRGSAALVDAIRRAGVHDPRVIETFQRVARSRFVPVHAVALADTDGPIPIGHEQVTTQPSLIARMVEALELSGDERVLEIGTGLGYQAAILGTLSREVYSIERLRDLAAQARDNLRAAGFENVVVLVGDGMLGLAAHAPYDAIVVAAAAPVVPPALVEQLTEGGRLVQPMGPGGNELVTKFRKRGGRLVREANLVNARFVPLIPGPVGDLREPAFNLLVATLPLAPGRARQEIVARLRKLTGAAPDVVYPLARGILAVKVAFDPREVVQRLRALCEREPRAFRYTLKWVPVDRWARPELAAMEDAVAQLRSRIGSNETWRMTVECRTDTASLDPNHVIRSLAELIDARVDLNHPDKVLLVQLFDAWVSFSVVAPTEVLSVVKMLAARPARAIPPNSTAARQLNGRT